MREINYYNKIKISKKREKKITYQCIFSFDGRLYSSSLIGLFIDSRKTDLKKIMLINASM